MEEYLVSDNIVEFDPSEQTEFGEYEFIEQIDDDEAMEASEETMEVEYEEFEQQASEPEVEVKPEDRMMFIKLGELATSGNNSRKKLFSRCNL